MERFNLHSRNISNLLQIHHLFFIVKLITRNYRLAAYFGMGPWCA